MDGMDVLRHLRAAHSMLPALILTARDSVTLRPRRIRSPPPRRPPPPRLPRRPNTLVR
jgi:hypothetical protein